MTTPSSTGLFGPRFARDLWRLTRIYWSSPDAPIGALLLALCISLELATVHASVMIADAERRIFDALGDRDVTSFFSSMGLFLAVTVGFVVASTYRIYVRARLEIRWRLPPHGQGNALVAATESAIRPWGFENVRVRPRRVSKTVASNATLVFAERNTQKCWLTAQALSTLTRTSQFEGLKNQKRPASSLRGWTVPASLGACPGAVKRTVTR